MILRSLTTILALAALTLVSACGGGSGGSSGGSSGGGGGGDNPAPTTRNAAFTADPADTVMAARAAARATPRFGSVHQTAHTGVSNVTDVTTTRQADDTFTFAIQRADGTTTTLNTGTDAVAIQRLASPSGREAQSGTLVTSDSTSITAATGVADWNPNDLGDWIVGGYWLHIRGDWANDDVTGVEVGAFVDGPELVDHTGTPTSGTATYNGLAAGLYAGRYGTDTTGVAGTYEMGDYSGRFQATANFADGTVSGSVDNIRLVGLGVRPNGQTYIVNGSSPVRLIFEPASITRTNGRLGGTVRLVHPDYTFTSQQGRWGSRLSNQDDGAGNPRALAGTHAGGGRTAGGTEVVYIGGHAGTTGDF